MKKLIIIITSVGVFFFVGFQSRTAIAQQANKIWYQSKCDTPLRYRIGKIDPRFNVTTDELASETQEAGDIWSNLVGKKLFVYDPKAKLTVNLNYDERQSLNTEINQLDTKLEQEKQNVIDPQVTEYERKSAELKRKFADLQSRFNTLNAEINEWNNKGGAPEEEYKRLIDEQKKLNEEQDALNSEADQLNKLAASLNQATQNYNEKVDKLHETVDTYNLTLSYKPEEGIYISDEKGERIIIYFYNSKQELVHTLSHEMGHALGIEHVDNPQAIMFSKTNNIITPASDDIEQLTEVCRKRNLVEATREKLPKVISEFRQNLINVGTSLLQAKPSTNKAEK